ncbi:hypothetical protein EON65_33305 [archaeon]|nr:MAG: hypothetical protein EON65_33305 [archaeon]
MSDLSGQIRSFVLVRITSRNSNSSHNSSQAGTFRRAPGGVDRKNTGTETLTSVASTLESLKLNSEQQAVPSILECNSQDADLTPKKLVLKSLEQSHSEFEESYSIDRFKEDTQNLFHVKSSRAFRDVELDNAKCPVHINGKRVHPHSLRANAYLGSSSNEQNGRADPLNLSRKPVKRGSSLRRSLGKVVDTIHIISSMAKVLPIIDDEEFNQIADKTFVTHDMIGYEARQRGVCVESFSESSPLSLLS